MRLAALVVVGHARLEGGRDVVALDALRRGAVHRRLEQAERAPRVALRQPRNQLESVGRE